MSLSFRQIVMRGRVTLFIAMRKDILDALFTGAAAFCVGACVCGGVAMP
jgi:hypothetical protein